MQKRDIITLDNIKLDLSLVNHLNFENITRWRFAFSIPMTLLAILLGFAFFIAFENIWIGVLLFLMPLYHIIQYLIACKKYILQKKAIYETMTRKDICISVEHLSHISKETIYEPYGFLRGHATKEVSFLSFRSSIHWRLLRGGEFYKWSKEYCMNAYGIESTSISGDKFFLISLQLFQNITCVYPCKYFTLDENLKSEKQ